MAGGNKAIYEVIKNRVIERLTEAKKNGEVFHWVKSWQGKCCNAVTGREYRGINKLLLDGQYITYRQLKELAIKHPEKKFIIPKGTKQDTIYFYKFDRIAEEVETENGQEIQSKVVPLIRFYRAFNIDDIEGLPQMFEKDTVKPVLSEEMEKANAIIKDYCERSNLVFEEKTGGNKCCYYPKAHKVTVPKISQFKSEYEYYSSVFHELAHSTGKALGRDMSGDFGSESYSQEELIAELTSAMIMGRLGIEVPDSFENSVAYIDGWLSKIKESDVYFVASACTKAQKCCDLILNEVYVPEESSEEAA